MSTRLRFDPEQYHVFVDPETGERYDRPGVYAVDEDRALEYVDATRGGWSYVNDDVNDGVNDSDVESKLDTFVEQHNDHHFSINDGIAEGEIDEHLSEMYERELSRDANTGPRSSILIALERRAEEIDREVEFPGEDLTIDDV
jgi:hypothetical protein